MKEIEDLLNKIEAGDVEAVRHLLFILTDYLPNGIDNMVLLLQEEQRSLYLSSEGVKSVMVSRGEFLPFIESHMLSLPVERLKDKDLMAISPRISDVLRDIYNVLVKWLDYELTDNPLYPKAMEYVQWYRRRFKG